jgi:hypothetical protein
MRVAFGTFKADYLVNDVSLADMPGVSGTWKVV